jgi:hypothetical protein
MTEMDGRHAAELAILQAQRDALAMVVRGLWDCSRAGQDMDGHQIEAALLTAGLAEHVVARRNDPARRFEAGDHLIRLSGFGKAAMQVARP